MEKYIEMREAMTANGFTNEDIEEMIELEKEYDQGCEEIAADCEAEGYPANGDNYELRCSQLREFIDEQQDAICEKYEA